MNAVFSYGVVSLAVALSAATLPLPTTETFPVATPESQGLSSADLAALKEAIDTYAEEGAIVGAELLVIKNRRTVLHATAGWRDKEASLPMETGTIFNLRSMTKPLVGAAIQILIDEGALRPDSRAAEFLTGFDHDRSRHITIQQLLEHRAGLPVSILTRLDEFPDLISLGNAVGTRGPEHTPGSMFFYSDAGADALGAIVERVTGRDLEAFISERLLEPIGMADTFATPTAGDARMSRVASLYARPQTAWVRAWTPTSSTLYPFLWGSQGLYGTAEDYARFLAMWIDGGTVGDHRLLSQAAMERTLTPASRLTNIGSTEGASTHFSGLVSAYGEFAELHTDALPRSNPGNATTGAGFGRVRIIGHSGSDGTSAWAWPDDDLMVLYFTQSRGNLTHLRLERVIDHVLLHADAPAADTPAPKTLEPLLGTYVANFGPFHNTLFRVFVQDGYLAVDVPGQFITEVHEDPGSGKWVSTLVSRLAVSFERDASGTVVAVNWHDGAQSFRLPRGEARVLPTLQRRDVERFLGRYRDPATHTEVEMIFVAGVLAARLPSVPAPVSFDPPDEQGFRAVQANPLLRIRFDENAAGEVVSYTVFAPDGSTSVRPRIRLPLQ